MSHRGQGTWELAFAILWSSYIDVFIQNKGKDRPEGEEGCIAQLQVGVKNRYGNVEEDAREYELDNGNNEASMDDEIS